MMTDTTSCLLQPTFPPGQPTSVVFATPPPPQMNPPPQPRQVGPPAAQRTRVKVPDSFPSLLVTPWFLIVYKGQIFIVTTELEHCMSWLFCRSDAVAVFAVTDASHCSYLISCQLGTAGHKENLKTVLWFYLLAQSLQLLVSVCPLCSILSRNECFELRMVSIFP